MTTSTRTTATPEARVDVGSSVTGRIDFDQDADWSPRRRLVRGGTAETGKRYQIDLEGRATGRGSLYDPLLRGIFDADGNEIHGNWNDDGGEGYNSRLLFTPDATAPTTWRPAAIGRSRGHLHAVGDGGQLMACDLAIGGRITAMFENDARLLPKSGR